MGNKTAIDLAEYNSIHSWIKYRYGKANRCEHCKDSSKKNFQYALKKGCVYARNRNNFIMLCISCHRIYDGVDIKNLHTTRTEADIKRAAVSKHKKIKQIDANGEVKKVWDSVTEAAISLGVAKSAISGCLHGNVKRVKGFTWEFQSKQ